MQLESHVLTKILKEQGLNKFLELVLNSLMKLERNEFLLLVILHLLKSKQKSISRKS